MFIEPRRAVSVDELLRGMIVNSGNDASVVLAEGVGGTVETFLEMMNRQAQAWGLISPSESTMAFSAMQNAGRTADNPGFFREALGAGATHILLEKPGAPTQGGP